MAKVMMKGVVVSITYHRGWWGPYRHIGFASEEPGRKGCWFSETCNGSGGLSVGNRGTITGYTSERHEYNRLIRVSFDDDITPLPPLFQSAEALSLIRSARKEPEDPVRRLVIAEWLSEKAGSVNQALAEVMLASLEVDGFRLLQRKVWAEAAPFTGAWRGWLIGNQATFAKDKKLRLWLDWTDYLFQFKKDKKKRPKRHSNLN